MRVRLFAAARAAARTGACELPAPAARTTGALRAALVAETGSEELERVLARCTLLVDGSSVPPSDDAARVLPGALVDVLPPFAGG